MGWKWSLEKWLQIHSGSFLSALQSSFRSSVSWIKGKLDGTMSQTITKKLAGSNLRQTIAKLAFRGNPCENTIHPFNLFTDNSQF